MNDSLTLGGFLLILSVLSLHVYLAVYKQWDNAVKGSHQRYVYATAAIITNYIMLLLPVFSGVAYWAEGKPFWAIILFVVFAILLSKLFPVLGQDDDNWFSKQWGKIKNGVKNFVTAARLQPSASPSAG